MENLDKILRTVERISFSLIGLTAGIFLINSVASLGPGTYGRTLIEGLSVYFIFGGIIFLLWVAYNVFTYSRPDKKDEK